MLPSVSKVNFVSDKIAVAVANEAKKEGLNRIDFEDAEECVSKMRWEPSYK